MLRLIRLTLAIIGIVVIVVLSVVNRTPVTVSFWPLDERVSVPLFAVAIACFGLGVLVTGVFTLCNDASSRLQARRNRRQLAAITRMEERRAEAADQAELLRLRERQAKLALPGQTR